MVWTKQGGSEVSLHGILMSSMWEEPDGRSYAVLATHTICTMIDEDKVRSCMQ